MALSPVPSSSGTNPTQAFSYNGAPTGNPELEEIDVISQCPQIRIFGENAWKKHYGDPGKVPPLPSNTLEVLLSPSDIDPEKRVFEMYLLYLQPAKINGECLGPHLKKVVFSKEGDLFPKGPEKKYLTNYIRMILSEEKVRKERALPSKWKLVAIAGIPESSKKNAGERIRLVQDLNALNPLIKHKIPKVFDVAAASAVRLVMRYDSFFPNGKEVKDDQCLVLGYEGRYAYRKENLVPICTLKERQIARVEPPISCSSSDQVAPSSLDHSAFVEKRAIGEKDLISRLPMEMMIQILGSLSQLEVDKIATVSRTFYLAARAPQLLLQFPRIRIFGERAWKKYYGDPGPVPSLPAHTLEVLLSPSPVNPAKPLFTTHWLYLKPATVDGKPLGKQLKQLVAAPKKGKARDFCVINCYEEVRKRSSPRSEWKFITLSVLPGSLDKTYAEQIKLVQQLNSPQNPLVHTVPTLSDVAVARATRLVREEPLFADGKFVDTRCQELKRMEGKMFRISGGSFSGDIDHSSPDFAHYNEGLAVVCTLPPALTERSAGAASSSS